MTRGSDITDISSGRACLTGFEHRHRNVLLGLLRGCRETYSCKWETQDQNDGVGGLFFSTFISALLPGGCGSGDRNQITPYLSFFSWYFLLPLILQIIVVRHGLSSPEICFAFPLLEPVRNVIYILVAWELCGDLRSLGRLRVGVAFLSAAGMILSFAAPGSHLYHGVILSIVRMERGVAFSLGVFTVAMLYLAAKYSITLPRNSVVLLTFWSIWFLGDSAMLTAASFLPAGYSFVVNDGLAIFEITSYIGWALLLSKVGEGEQGLMGMAAGTIDGRC